MKMSNRSSYKMTIRSSCLNYGAFLCRAGHSRSGMWHNKTVQTPSQLYTITPVTVPPLQGNPYCIAKSSSVVMHSPWVWWNALISGCHLSTNVINAKSNMKYPIINILKNLVDSKYGTMCRPALTRTPLVFRRIFRMWSGCMTNQQTWVK